MRILILRKYYVEIEYNVMIKYLYYFREACNIIMSEFDIAIYFLRKFSSLILVPPRTKQSAIVMFQMYRRTFFLFFRKKSAPLTQTKDIGLGYVCNFFPTVWVHKYVIFGQACFPDISVNINYFSNFICFVLLGGHMKNAIQIRLLTILEK